MGNKGVSNAAAIFAVCSWLWQRSRVGVWVSTRSHSRSWVATLRFATHPLC